MTRHKKYVVTAMCITLCAVLPLTLHFIPRAGSTVMPMHIPVLLCGLIVGPYFGFLAGLLGPLLSSFTTGMPLMAYVPVMMIELAAYGLFCGIFAKIFRARSLRNGYLNLYAAMIPAMLIGRILGGMARIFLYAPALYNETLLIWWLSSYFVTSLPGIIIQLALIPAIVVALEKSRVLE